MKKQCTKIAGSMLFLMLLGAPSAWAQVRPGTPPPPGTTPTETINTWISKFAWEENEIPIPPYTWEPFGSKYETFWSPTVGKTVSYLIYLPPSYNTSTKRYPVVYSLPGGSGTQFQVGSFLQDLEAAINAGQAPEMIVIGVNGIVCCSFYADSYAGDLPLETIIIKDLIPHIDSTYRTITQREFRAVEGFSMGGYGAVHLGFKYPEMFGIVSDHAGALFDIALGKASLCCDNIYRAWNYVFGANEAYFTANYPFTLAQQNADSIRGRTHIRIMVGDLDQSWLIQKNTELHQLLQSLNITHEFQIVPGAPHDKFTYYDILGFSTFNPFYLQAFSFLPGDLGGPQGAEMKDGKVDIYDVSILLSKWNSLLSADLLLVDINPGPNNISLGKIDIYDANKLMANWTSISPPPPPPPPPPPSSSTVVQKSEAVCGPDCKVYTLGVTCQNLPERVLDLEERGQSIKGTILFGTGGYGNTYYPDDIPSYVRSQGFQTYKINWNGFYGWGTGAGGAGYKKAMCGYAEVVKWIKDKNIAINSDVMCATGNSGGSFQIGYGLSLYGLEDYLDMVILTGGPPISRLDIGCFTAGDPAYWPINLRGRAVTDYMLGGEYCTKGDGSNPAVVKQFQDESLASPTEYRDYDFPKTKVNFVNSVDDWTVADEQGKIYYGQLPNDPSRKSWYDIPGSEHNVPTTVEGSMKIKELFVGECK